MTPRRLTMAEAEELLDMAFDLLADPIATDTDGVLDEVIAGVSADDARLLVYGMLDLMTGSIDPASIEISPDRLDDAPDMDACRIIIKTREWQ